MTAQDIRQEMIDLQLKLNATRQKFIASLPEATKAQVANVVKAIKSDKLTVSDTGLNTEFKITNKTSLKIIAAAKTARLNSLNTKTGKAKVLKSLQGAKKITSFHIGKPRKGKGKGKDGLAPTPIKATWEV